MLSAKIWIADMKVFWNAVLTNLGERMSDDEVDELLKAVDTSSGEINYIGRLCSGRCANIPRLG